MRLIDWNTLDADGLELLQRLPEHRLLADGVDGDGVVAAGQGHDGGRTGAGEDGGDLVER